MAESYEVVLQQVAVRDLLGLLGFLEASSRELMGLVSSESFINVGGGDINKALIEEVIAYKGDVCLAGRLYEFLVSPTISLPCVLLRVVKYSEGVDVELSFNEVPFLNADCVMRAMRDYSDDLSNRFEFSQFYGGLEPAVDVNTRYFTGNSFGPLGL
ncbi:hypothetical protein HU734_017605 [Pseudomonas wayambapalatensis]|uniref:hypothetical protein n=1 Tax=Pseudomonas sp. L7 TaxID=3388343 RepID=UPI001646D467|nr:hypothetical protein HU734_017605 [Pseudomonas wayambapalatensis]